jgi:hypothetical protein
MRAAQALGSSLVSDDSATFGIDPHLELVGYGTPPGPAYPAALAHVLP